MIENTFFHLICMNENSGLPLFTRSIGKVPPLPDPVISSLNGIYAFCSSYGVKLMKTTSGDTCICWKTFNKNMTLIMATNASDEEWLHERLFMLIYNSFILMLGSSLLSPSNNFDRLKRGLEVCYHLVDALIGKDIPSCVTTMTANSLSSPDLPEFQVQFDGYASSMKTSLACFFINGLLSASTTKFLQLTALELVLLQLLVNSLVSSLSSPNIIETVIYLPDTSPKQGLRLVVLKLIKGGVVCLLCGEKPPLSEIILKVINTTFNLFKQQLLLCFSIPRQTQNYWDGEVGKQAGINFGRVNLDLVQNLSKMMNTSLPQMKFPNKDIVSFLILNKSSCQSLTCMDVNKTKRDTDLEHGRILKKFYQHVAHKIFKQDSAVTNIGQDILIECKVEDQNVAVASYMCLERYKCYAFQKDDRELYTVFKSSIPTYALRSASNELLRFLLETKWFHM